MAASASGSNVLGARVQCLKRLTRLVDGSGFLGDVVRVSEERLDAWPKGQFMCAACSGSGRRVV